MGKRNRERVARIKAGLEEPRVKRKVEVEDPNRFMFTRRVAKEAVIIPSLAAAIPPEAQRKIVCTNLQ